MLKMTTHSRALGPLLTALLLACGTAGYTQAQPEQQSQQPDKPVSTQANQQEQNTDSGRFRINPDELLQDTDQPLDERVRSPEQMTSSDPPPLPHTVILPKPPDFRIADSMDEVPVSPAHYDKAKAAASKGLAFLSSRQDESGGWLTEIQAAPTGRPDMPSPVAVAVTAMAVKAYVQCDPNWMQTDSFRRAMSFIRSAQNENGSFGGGSLSNYVTSTVVSALSAVDRNEYYDMIQDAVDWLKRNQWDQAEGIGPRKDWFGGAGYGNRGRPDMSNTQMMLDALYDAGVSPDEPAMQKALAFVSRAQNLKATNKSEWAGNDGGFIYTPANGGESMASEAAGEGRYGEHIPEGEFRSLRSYGSMTYAGFKSMLYAGLSPDDLRVRAAFDWIRNHYTFDENPGVGQQGLYYYYHTMSRALNVSQQHTIMTDEGETRNWREDLIDALLERQNENGSWENAADRWLEGIPEMATIYSVLALEETLKPALMLPDEQEEQDEQRQSSDEQ